MNVWLSIGNQRTAHHDNSRLFIYFITYNSVNTTQKSKLTLRVST